jgi:glycerate 2-kinase
MNALPGPEAQLRALFQAAVDAASPAHVLPPYLASIPDPRPHGRLIVIGAGKAAAAMAAAVRGHFGPCEGALVTRHGHAAPFARTAPDVIEAGHPVPDDAGVAATQGILDMVTGLRPQDVVIALISGGASSLLCAPRAGISLAQKQQITADLLRKGAPIGDINLIRKQFSRVKGGQLAAACSPAQVIALIISDVAGDDLADIGSGPTVGDARGALAAAQRWGIELPQPSPVLHPQDARLARVQNHLVAAPKASLQAAADLGAQMGMEVTILGDDLVGEAQALARQHAALFLDAAAGLKAGDAPRLFLSGGEATVTLNSRSDGIGGPNAEYALALALALQGARHIYALAADTDGIDGAGSAAGAWIGPQSMTDHSIALQDLQNHNAHGYFARFGGAITCGPTHTNVNDFRAAILLPPN